MRVCQRKTNQITECFTKIAKLTKLAKNSYWVFFVIIVSFALIVRGLRDTGGQARDLTNTPSDSTCGVFGKRSNARSDSSAYPPSSSRRASRAIVAGSHDT